jgi:hypothetical protein
MRRSAGEQSRNCSAMCGTEIVVSQGVAEGVAKRP